MFWDGIAMYLWERSDILKECSDSSVGAIMMGHSYILVGCSYMFFGAII